MDRRQQKSRQAILSAFTDLLAVKSYGRITVQEIIEAANVGRTTFYSHFETKEALLDTLSDELFGHIINDALNQEHTHGLYPDQEPEVSVFFHVLAHLQENDRNILKLLSGESRTLFMPYFKSGMKRVIGKRLHERRIRVDLPEEFLINHIAGSFIELVYWWIEGGMIYSPRQLDGYFRLVTEPLLE